MQSKDASFLYIDSDLKKTKKCLQWTKATNDFVDEVLLAPSEILLNFPTSTGRNMIEEGIFQDPVHCLKLEYNATVEQQ